MALMSLAPSRSSTSTTPAWIIRSVAFYMVSAEGIFESDMDSGLTFVEVMARRLGKCRQPRATHGEMAHRLRFRSMTLVALSFSHRQEPD